MSLSNPKVQAGEIVVPQMPVPGTMVELSPAFNPAFLKGITVYPNNPFQFDFIIDQGDGRLSVQDKQSEYKKLIQYFLASLTIPDQNQWVNLSPYEKDRIIDPDFGQTEMGRDLLAQDYLLKQITSSLIYPQKDLGKKFWDTIYAQSKALYGSTTIPVNMFNKVWIVPDKAVIFEKGTSAYVMESYLKVILEQDYLATQNNQRQTGDMASAVSPSRLPSEEGMNVKATQGSTVTPSVMKQLILPVLEKEINTGKNFAPLRQVYSGMLLAAWYKRALKESILNKFYADKNKLRGISPPFVGGARGGENISPESIYQQYLQAYKKGVFNFIKEEPDPANHHVIPKKYFSGGTKGYSNDVYDQAVTIMHFADPAVVAAGIEKSDLAMVVLNNGKKEGSDPAKVILGAAGLDNQEIVKKAIEALNMKPEKVSDDSKSDNKMQMISEMEINQKIDETRYAIQNAMKDKPNLDRVQKILFNFENAISPYSNYDDLFDVSSDVYLVFNEVLLPKYVIKRGAKKGKRLLLARIDKSEEYESLSGDRIAVFRTHLRVPEIVFQGDGFRNMIYVRNSKVFPYETIYLDDIEQKVNYLEKYNRGERKFVAVGSFSADDKPLADQMAANHSAVIKKLFERHNKRSLENIMIQGYTFYALEHQRLTLERKRERQDFSVYMNDVLISTLFSMSQLEDPMYVFSDVIHFAFTNVKIRHSYFAWQILQGISGKTSQIEMLEWLKNFSVSSENYSRQKEFIRAQAEKYYEYLTGRKAEPFYHKIEEQEKSLVKEELPASSQIKGPEVLPKSALTSSLTIAPMVTTVDPDVERRKLDDLKIKDKLQGLFVKQGEQRRMRINDIIAEAPGTTDEAHYLNTLKAITKEVSSPGVGNLMRKEENANKSDGQTVLRIERLLNEVLADFPKTRLNDFTFRAFFNHVPKGPRIKTTVLDEGIKRLYQQATEDDAVNHMPNRYPVEILALKNSLFIEESKSKKIDKDVLNEVHRVYVLIKQVEEGRLDISVLNRYSQRTFQGIYRKDLRDGWAVYFRYLKEQDKIVIIAFMSKEDNHEKNQQLTPEFKGHVRAYSASVSDHVSPERMISYGIRQTPADEAMINRRLVLSTAAAAFISRNTTAVARKDAENRIPYDVKAVIARAQKHVLHDEEAVVIMDTLSKNAELLSELIPSVRRLQLFSSEFISQLKYEGEAILAISRSKDGQVNYVQREGHHGSVFRKLFYDPVEGVVVIKGKDSGYLLIKLSDFEKANRLEIDFNEPNESLQNVIMNTLDKQDKMIHDSNQWFLIPSLLAFGDLKQAVFIPKHYFQLPVDVRQAIVSPWFIRSLFNHMDLLIKEVPDLAMTSPVPQAIVQHVQKLHTKILKNENLLQDDVVMIVNRSRSGAAAPAQEKIKDFMMRMDQWFMKKYGVVLFDESDFKEWTEVDGQLKWKGQVVFKKHPVSGLYQDFEDFMAYRFTVELITFIKSKLGMEGSDVINTSRGAMLIWHEANQVVEKLKGSQRRELEQYLEMRFLSLVDDENRRIEHNDAGFMHRMGSMVYNEMVRRYPRINIFAPVYEIKDPMIHLQKIGDHSFGWGRAVVVQWNAAKSKFEYVPGSAAHYIDEISGYVQRKYGLNDAAMSSTARAQMESLDLSLGQRLVMIRQYLMSIFHANLSNEEIASHIQIARGLLEEVEAAEAYALIELLDEHSADLMLWTGRADVLSLKRLRDMEEVILVYLAKIERGVEFEQELSQPYLNVLQFIMDRMRTAVTQEQIGKVISQAKSISPDIVLIEATFAQDIPVNLPVYEFGQPPTTIEEIQKRADAQRLKLFIVQFFDVTTFFVTKPLDNAMVNQNEAPGGVDMNAAHLDIQIKRDSLGLPLPWAQQDLAKMDAIQGLEPQILSIKPIVESMFYQQLSLPN